MRLLDRYSPFTKLTDKFLSGQEPGSQLLPYTICKFLTFNSVCSDDKVILTEFEKYFLSMIGFFQFDPIPHGGGGQILPSFRLSFL